MLGNNGDAGYLSPSINYDYHRSTLISFNYQENNTTYSLTKVDKLIQCPSFEWDTGLRDILINYPLLTQKKIIDKFWKETWKETWKKKFK